MRDIKVLKNFGQGRREKEGERRGRKGKVLVLFYQIVIAWCYFSKMGEE